MKKLEEQYKENREKMDFLEPSRDSWSKIQKGIKKDQQIKRSQIPLIKWLKVASVVIAICGISYFFINSSPNSDIDVTESLIVATQNQSLIHPSGLPATFDPTENRYTLVQFWSSGNVLCIEENCYYYLPAYEKYKAQGFEIYAVSLDNDIASWVESIESENYPWMHVSDLKGWDSPLCEECDVSEVPASFLLDDKGKVIARNLDASQLDQTLDRLFSQN